jgi:energy-coupling factor transporter ATP-binding protein EcfA2
MVCADAAKLPTYFYASPCAGVVHWWAASQRLRLLHAGCVAENGAAALLVGPSGSGKSTTSLMCAQAGMNYIGDDICLLQPGVKPEAICLYNSGKLLRQNLQNFPLYASLAVDPGPDREDKPVIFLHQHFPDKIAHRLPIKAIVVPRVSDRQDTVITPISSAEGLKALAPSTLFMRPPYEVGAFSTMAALVRSQPCFRLDLGTIGPEVPDAVRAVLARSH